MQTITSVGLNEVKRGNIVGKLRLVLYGSKSFGELQDSDYSEIDNILTDAVSKINEVVNKV